MRPVASLSIFLSYSSQDSTLAKALYIGLINKGFFVWKAPEDIQPGEDWAVAIYKALEKSDIFLLLWTDDSMNSNEVTKEITLATRKQKIIIPVRATWASPRQAQEFHLSNTQWLEAQERKQDEIVDLVCERIQQIEKDGIKRPNLIRRVLPDARVQLLLKASLAIIGIFSIASDLDPFIAPNQTLLNQRLFWQARWRQLTDQPGPNSRPIGLLQLGQQIYEDLGESPTEKSVNQAVLAKVLVALPVDRPKKIGLDFILDRPSANPEGDLELAATLKRDRYLNRQVFAGLCPPNSLSPDESALDPCFRSKDSLSPLLAEAGAIPVYVSVAMDTTDRRPPLILLESLGYRSFAYALAPKIPVKPIPQDAILDWSINWFDPRYISFLSDTSHLKEFDGNSLIIASDGYKGSDMSTVADQHTIPDGLLAYVDYKDPKFITLSKQTIPGGFLQAVLAQSLANTHWLMPATPFNNTFSTIILALIAYMLTRAQALKTRRGILLASIPIVYTLLALQICLSFRKIVPVLLPVSAATLIVFIRRNKKTAP